MLPRDRTNDSNSVIWREKCSAGALDKTNSKINQLAHQVFQNEPTWNGLCIDEKSVYWETLAAMAKHYGRVRDLIHLQIRTNDTDAH